MSTTAQESLTDREQFDLQHDRTVRDESERIRAKANDALAGAIPADEFRPFRLRYGIYGQGQPNVQMGRTKIPSGLLSSRQLDALAAISDEFAGSKGHITTRQNLQFHFVPLARVADL